MCVVAIVTMLLTIPSALVAAQVLGWWSVDGMSSTATPPATRIPSASPSLKPSETVSGESGENVGQVVTGCYKNDESVPCHAEHDQEIYSPMSAGVCDESSLILYLGGDPEVDVLGEELLVAESERDSALCSVRSSGDLINGSLEGVWSTDGNGNGYLDGGRYRRCFTYQQQPVSCDEEHSAEVFYEGEEDVDCILRYEVYSGRKADHTIAVVREVVEATVTCRVEVRATSDTLFASVRGIENVSLPLR